MSVERLPVVTPIGAGRTGADQPQFPDMNSLLVSLQQVQAAGLEGTGLTLYVIIPPRSKDCSSSAGLPSARLSMFVTVNISTMTKKCRFIKAFIRTIRTGKFSL